MFQSGHLYFGNNDNSKTMCQFQSSWTYIVLNIFSWKCDIISKSDHFHHIIFWPLIDNEVHCSGQCDCCNNNTNKSCQHQCTSISISNQHSTALPNLFNVMFAFYLFVLSRAKEIINICIEPCTVLILTE